MSKNKRVVLITGGGSGIGAASVRKFVENEFHTVAVDIDDEGQALCDRLIAEGGSCQFLRCDVADEGQVRSLIYSVIEECGRIDVLVNNAGMDLTKPLCETTWAEFRRVVDVNLGGQFLLCKYVLPVMKKQGGGAIVNIASISAHVGKANRTIYCSTKGAIAAFTRALALEVGPYNIRVNSISPGAIDTPLLWSGHDVMSKIQGLSLSEMIAKTEAGVVLRRLGKPEEVAEAICFLASSAASFVTGSDLLVDGGFVAK